MSFWEKWGPEPGRYKAGELGADSTWSGTALDEVLKKSRERNKWRQVVTGAEGSRKDYNHLEW
jgi:hypothetical protein